jgi:hypothetical protein
MKPGAESEAVMKKMLRNATLSAAALAALVCAAPKASAAHFPFPPTPREMREMWRERHGDWHHPHYARYYSGPRYRVYAGHRFYAYRPGPGYVHVRGYGWCYPPYAGAVWVPGHYNRGGIWIEAHFR